MTTTESKCPPIFAADTQGIILTTSILGLHQSRMLIRKALASAQPPQTTEISIYADLLITLLEFLDTL